MKDDETQVGENTRLAPLERQVRRLDYFWARGLVQVSGIVFLSQLVLTMSGFAQRKPGFGWVTPICGVAFGLSVAYAVVLIVINAIRERATDA